MCVRAGRGADERKEICGGSDGGEPRRLTCSGEVQIGKCVCGNLIERMVLFYPIAQVGKRYGHLIHAALRAFFPDGHKSIGLMVWKWAKQTPLITLNIAVFAPMPSASVITAMAVKPGCFSRLLIPYRRSLSSVSIIVIVRFFRLVFGFWSLVFGLWS